MFRMVIANDFPDDTHRMLATNWRSWLAISRTLDVVQTPIYQFFTTHQTGNALQGVASQAAASSQALVAVVQEQGAVVQKQVCRVRVRVRVRVWVRFTFRVTLRLLTCNLLYFQLPKNLIILRATRWCNMVPFCCNMVPF
jgi:hypothetical protein